MKKRARLQQAIREQRARARARRKARKPPAGARPGTLVVDATLPPPTIRLVSFDAKELEERAIADPEELARISRGSPVSPTSPGSAAGRVSWIDVQGLGDARVLERIGELFAIHPLALEDVVNVPVRPKVETYDAHELVIARALEVGAEHGGQPGAPPGGQPAGQPGGQSGAQPGGEAGPAATELLLRQVTLFVGKSYVITFQERPSALFEPVLRRIRMAQGRIRRSRPDYLAYALIDTIIDTYTEPLDRLGDVMEDLEDEILASATPELLRRLNELRNTLSRVRRSVVPQRDAILSLLRDTSPYFGKEARVFLRDTHDHCVQAADAIEARRELLNGLMNTYLTVVSNRMNEVMKVLTIISSLFVPLTFLAGIYGMNFTHMPELRTRWGYFVLLAVMAVTTVLMIWWFRRRGWIGGPARPAPHDPRSDRR